MPESFKAGEKRRERILKFIERYTAKNGFAPSMKEIADAVGPLSTNAVRTHLLVLEGQGKLTMKPRVARSIVLTGQ